ncbi:TonB-dependent siderophore receptor [Cyanobacterium aponinum AL20118]|uniref:TonB-dependent siderophore receptor n=1 Tax=Cyanobacterium aponinum AL20115 TaxID=3090662 RepID=A0AAF0ZH39_9CHRO|nr:TonB-dependent siderophore receptor [Cyanobacterium aponinum]WPF89209.1 TonB-dependent siderophore receptor [Cyanobacterium aponinum AL20115]
MKTNKLLFFMTLTGLIPLINQHNVKAENLIINKDNHLFAQVTIDSIITNIELRETDNKLELILQGNNLNSLQPLIFPDKNNLIIEFIDTQLSLSQGEEFLQLNPTDDIQEIQAINVEGGVRITIAGNNQLPTVEVTSINDNLVFGITIADIAQTEEQIEIVATQEVQEEDYFIPDATTATLTDTPIRDVPQSIQVIPEQIIRDQQLLDLGDALRNVSGVQQTSADPRGQRFQIRGFSDASVLRDGFRQTFGRNGNIGFPDLGNLERIEVLKGPASILFGVVEPGGVINLVTKKPLKQPFYEAQLQVGNRGLIRPSFDISGPFNPDGEGNLFYRVNASYQSEASFRDFDTDIRRFFISPVFSWETEKVNLLVNVEYLNDERPNDFGLTALGDKVANIPRERNLGEPNDIARIEQLRLGYRFEYNFSDNWKIRHAFNYLSYDSYFETANAGSLNEETGILSRNFISLDQPSETYEIRLDTVGKFNTGAIEHQLLAGIDFFKRQDLNNIGRGDFFTNIPINIFNPIYNTVPRPNFQEEPVFFDGDTTVDAFGFFLQDQIAFTDNLKLLAGFRYDNIDQSNTNRPSVFSPEGSTDSQNNDAFTPRIGLVYQPIEPISLYGSYSRSFVPNSAITVNGNLLDPEEGEQFEFGIKTELLDKKLSFTASYFNLTKRNVATPDPDFPNFSVATGEQKSEGFELDLIGEILPGWNMVANYAYIDAKITQDNRGLEGNKLYSVPPNSFNFWTSYEIQQGDLQGLGFGLGFNYVDQRFGDNANSFTLDSYFLTNAGIFYNRDNWRVALNFRNIFDVNYIRASENRRVNEIYPGEPFTVIGSISVKF